MVYRLFYTYVTFCQRSIIISVFPGCIKLYIVYGKRLGWPRPLLALAVRGGLFRVTANRWAGCRQGHGDRSISVNKIKIGRLCSLPIFQAFICFCVQELLHYWRNWGYGTVATTARVATRGNGTRPTTDINTTSNFS